MDNITTSCCIVGGGPAGIMAGFLLARNGIDVVVLEKHEDFFRDFRGDTVHPSTLEAFHELGLLDKFLTHPHQKVPSFNGKIGDKFIKIGDFSHLKVAAPYIAMMPQWDFLSFLSEEAKKLSNFKLLMGAEVTGLLFDDNNKVIGVKANNLEVHSKLVIGSDGRHSVTRQAAKLKVIDYGAPIDVLWFRLPRKNSDPEESAFNLAPGKMMVMINRGDYWQCAFVIPKGKIDEIKSQGLEKFQNLISSTNQILEGRVVELDDWDKVKLLTVQVNMLDKWYLDGYLAIGDASHAMSPVGGVGINLAIQDAIATSNILSKPLLADTLTIKDLEKVEKRRKFPARMTQRVQIMAHKKIIGEVISNQTELKIPLFIKLLDKIPFLSRITGYLIGIGIRPEKIKN